MASKEEAKTTKDAGNERIYTIPLRKAFRKSYRIRTPYAARLVREYLEQHTKSKNVKLGKHLNEAVWERGTRKPPRRVRVKAVIDGETVRAELLGHEYEAFVTKKKEAGKGLKDKIMDRLGPKAAKKQEEEQRAEGKKEEKETTEAAKPAAEKAQQKPGTSETKTETASEKAPTQPAK